MQARDKQIEKNKEKLKKTEKQKTDRKGKEDIIERK